MFRSLFFVLGRMSVVLLSLMKTVLRQVEFYGIVGNGMEVIIYRCCPMKILFDVRRGVSPAFCLPRGAMAVRHIPLFSLKNDGWRAHLAVSETIPLRSDDSFDDLLLCVTCKEALAIVPLVFVV